MLDGVVHVLADFRLMVLGQGGQNFYLQCQPKWTPCERDNSHFLEFLAAVLRVLDAAQPPPPMVDCEFCQRLHSGPKALAH